MRTLLRTSLLAVLISLPTLLPAQTARTVLLEQFTGTWCQWCPYGADAIDQLLQQNPNLRALAYHQGDPMATSDGNSVIQHLLVGSYPSGAVDRRLWNTPNGLTIALSRSYWQSAVNSRLAAQSLMSIGVSGTYHQDTRVIDATVTMTALADTAGEFYLNVVISEDDLDHAQKKNVNGSVVTIDPYYHQRVVRNMVTGWIGSQITASGLTNNQTYTHNFQFTVPAGYDISKTKLTAFVTEKFTLYVNQQPQNKSMNIMQAWQEPVTTALSVIPVELISFNATQVGDGVRLQWRTASESNNRGWHIERRTPESAWKDIGFVDGYGTTSEQQVYEFTDGRAALRETYDYRLRQVDFDGKTDYSPVFRIMTAPVPTATRLLPNYPNPFNPTTNIAVELAEDGPMTVEIHDMLGRRLRTLAEGVHQAGGHVFEWNGRDDNGVTVESGIYFVRLTTADHSETRQMQMTK